MERTFTTDTDVTAGQLYDVVSDLGTFSEWMPLVARVDPIESEEAWMVTLKARIGPLARAKRLRMVRTQSDGHQVRFERQELDDRQHAPWTLTASVSSITEASSSVTVGLHYGGSMWTGPLEAVLDRAADDAIAGLHAYIAQPAA